MDEQRVRLWLKEHQDMAEKLVQQKTAAFTLQFDTLRAELQAIRGLLPNQNGGDGDHGMLLTRVMRLDVPKFNGVDLNGWIFAINGYFDLHETTQKRRLFIIGFNLEGDATEWHRWMTRNKLVMTWDSFLESVKIRFGPLKYED
ncbi:hypothetical protein CTI12_AA186890 [Artemisia annua]|uniref:Retrotransposon gag domain-containing protein n=1 Tax=Artemisia annua TaxID=35608 RepID=A0A2U1P6J0_ARTAN|nr:hypothetical protein CTI12_AA186890 [Artemisia annua]